MPILSPLAAAEKSFRLSVRVESLFARQPPAPLSERMRSVAEAGYPAFEFGNWRQQDPAVITRRARELKLECAGIVNTPIGVANRDAVRALGPQNPAFLPAVRDTVEAAKRFETRRFVVLGGRDLPGIPGEEQHARIVEGLKRAHDIVAPHGITMIIEPVNTLVEQPGAYLHSSHEAFRIVREVGGPYLKVLYDIYQMQVQEGNLIATIRENIRLIGHFHAADAPAVDNLRREPGTGEINYVNVFRAIRNTGYSGFIGMEYGCAGDPVASLIRVRRLAETI